MDAMNNEEVQKQVRSYIVVFVALLGLTIVTVTVSYLHLEVRAAIAIALFVATVKASLVAGYFMHLISERKVIYATLCLTGVFLVALLLLPTSHLLNPVVN